jgi:hypothetical protein
MSLVQRIFNNLARKVACRRHRKTPNVYNNNSEWPAEVTSFLSITDIRLQLIQVSD